MSQPLQRLILPTLHRETIMDFLNNILFPVLLFFFYFALYSAFTPKTTTPVTTEEYNPLDEIKRAFSAEFDPEPPLQLTVISYQ